MWKIVIDISGMPPDNIYIGGFLINENYKSRFITEFYDCFPELLSYTKKSTKAKPRTLFEVLKFFDEKRLRMACYHFNDFQWKLHERRLNQLMKDFDNSHIYSTHFGGFKEKLIGILYYSLITHLGVRSDFYEVVVCAESYLDIWQVIDVIYKLSKRDGWKIKVFPQLRKHEHLLKMADYVAGANRKIERDLLHSIVKHTILSNSIRDFDLRKVFKIYSQK